MMTRGRHAERYQERGHEYCRQHPQRNGMRCHAKAGANAGSKQCAPISATRERNAAGQRCDDEESGECLRACNSCAGPNEFAECKNERCGKRGERIGFQRNCEKHDARGGQRGANAAKRFMRHATVPNATT
jgi:hypothetical protein